MTEKEKMLRGMLYAPARDETLLAELAACKAQCQQFNQRAYQAEGIESAQMLLRRLLGAAGEGLRIEPPFWCDYGWNISVGRNFYMNHGGVILDAGGVTFGDNVLVGPQCGFYTSGHPLDAAKRAQGLEYAYPIRVGSGVWIGGGVRVMPGRLHRRRGGHRLRQRGDEGHPCRSPGCGRPLPPHPPHHGGGPGCCPDPAEQLPFRKISARGWKPLQDVLSWGRGR